MTLVLAPGALVVCRVVCVWCVAWCDRDVRLVLPWCAAVIGVPRVGVPVVAFWCESRDDGAMQAEASRRPDQWLEDMTWHRRMFRESHFRWVPEDPMGVALTWTRGRLTFETPKHLLFLDDRLDSLREFAAQIDDAMLSPLADAQRELTPAAWRNGLSLIGLTPARVEVLRRAAPRRLTPNPEARRVLRGIPLPNPLSMVWELRQVRGMYAAAEDLIEDAFSDLALELAPTCGWDCLAESTLLRSARSLQTRVQQQRARRGEPGDPRRTATQRY